MRAVVLTLENGISDASSIHRGTHVMGANDVRTCENQRGVRGDGAQQPLLRRSVFAVAPQQSSDEGFPRSADEQRKSQPVQFFETAQQGIVLFEALAEAKSGIE